MRTEDIGLCFKGSRSRAPSFFTSQPHPGYGAAISIGLGSLIWNVWQLDLNPFQHTALFALAVARCAVALWMFQRLYLPARQATWTTPTLHSVLVLAVICTTWSPRSFALAVLACATPYQTLTMRELASLFEGTILGSFDGFVAFNLTFTTDLSIRLKDD